MLDIIANPGGRGFLERDAKNVATWFAKAGLPGADPGELGRLPVREARLE